MDDNEKRDDTENLGSENNGNSTENQGESQNQNEGYTYGGYQPYNAGYGYGYTPNPPQPPKKSNKLVITAVIVAIALLLVMSIGLVYVVGEIIPLLDSLPNDELDGEPGGGLLDSDLIDSEFTLTQPSTPGTAHSTLADAYDATHKTFVEINTASETSGMISAGSGVIIARMSDNKGYYIVTNNHVVEDATKITVKLYDGTEYTAHNEVFTDEMTDLAVIVIEETKELPVAKLGKSESLRVGESIYVIGNPLGTLAGTLTDGIVSAKAQEIYIGNHYMNLLQTNAAINPGNSGGPMFNMAGELVGIVNAKYASVEVEGIGFAIPIDTVASIVEQMISQGYVTGRHNLGIATEHNLYGIGGLWISSLSEDSALVKAGMPYKANYAYQILSINGKQFLNAMQANDYIDNLKAGQNVTVTVAVYEMSFTNITPVEQKTYNVTLAQKYANE